jgi:hypothetical protein
MTGVSVKAPYWLLAAAAFVLGSAFSSDNAGKACVTAKGERGVSYDVYKTKVKDAYAPGGRRMLQDGHRIYEVEVPASIKRDKPIMCTMTLANGMWEAPSFNAVDRGLPTVGSRPKTDEKRPADTLMNAPPR